MSISKKRAVIALLAISSLIFTAACGDGVRHAQYRQQPGRKRQRRLGSPRSIPQFLDRLPCRRFRRQCRSEQQSSKVGSRLSRDEIADIIANGKPNTRMPAFSKQLSKKNIKSSPTGWLR